MASRTAVGIASWARVEVQADRVRWGIMRDIFPCACGQSCGVVVEEFLLRLSNLYELISQYYSMSYKLA